MIPASSEATGTSATMAPCGNTGESNPVVSVSESFMANDVVHQVVDASGATKCVCGSRHEDASGMS